MTNDAPVRMRRQSARLLRDVGIPRTDVRSIVELVMATQSARSRTTIGSGEKTRESDEWFATHRFQSSHNRSIISEPLEPDDDRRERCVRPDPVVHVIREIRLHLEEPRFREQLGRAPGHRDPRSDIPAEARLRIAE